MGGKGRGKIRGEARKVTGVVADASIMDSLGKRYGAIFFKLSVTSNSIICLPEDNCFGRCFTHSQFKSTVVSCIVAMLIGAIDVLSGGLHMYFVMRELTGGTFKFIMRCACLWINIFSQIISWNTGHEINNSANILKSVNRKNKLITWEKIFIHKHSHHIMNFEVRPVSSLIKKYVCRPPDSASMAPTNIATTQDTAVDLN